MVPSTTDAVSDEIAVLTIIAEGKEGYIESEEDGIQSQVFSIIPIFGIYK